MARVAKTVRAASARARVVNLANKMARATMTLTTKWRRMSPVTLSVTTIPASQLAKTKAANRVKRASARVMVGSAAKTARVARIKMVANPAKTVAVAGVKMGNKDKVANPVSNKRHRMAKEIKPAVVKGVAKAMAGNAVMVDNAAMAAARATSPNPTIN